MMKFISIQRRDMSYDFKWRFVPCAMDQREVKATRVFSVASYASVRLLQFVHGYHETPWPSIPNLSGRDRPLPVASVCVGEHHVCVESSEHVAKAIAFQWGNSKYRSLDHSAPLAI